MNESEQVVADTLDALHIEWEYEPTLFVLSKDKDGKITSGFRPDFWLKDYNLYVEVTMGKNSNVTAKNAKARKALELYPGNQIAIIFRRDFIDIRARLLELVALARLGAVEAPGRKPSVFKSET